MLVQSPARYMSHNPTSIPTIANCARIRSDLTGSNSPACLINRYFNPINEHSRGTNALCIPIKRHFIPNNQHSQGTSRI